MHQNKNLEILNNFFQDVQAILSLLLYFINFWIKPRISFDYLIKFYDITFIYFLHWKFCIYKDHKLNFILFNVK